MGFSHDRGTDLVRRDHNSAIGCPTPHLDPVNGKVSDIFAFYHGGVGEEVSNDHYSLSSKSGYDDVVIKAIASHKLHHNFRQA
jgi:hypothetical protein